MSSDETYPTRSVPLTPRPAAVCPIYWILLIEISDISRPSHYLDECGARPFLIWVRAQVCSLDAPGIPKNALGPVSIPLKSEGRTSEAQRAR